MFSQRDTLNWWYYYLTLLKYPKKPQSGGLKVLYISYQKLQIQKTLKTIDQFHV